MLVPSLSFVMFTLIQGDQTGPLDVLRELGNYLAAVFLQGELGGAHFQSQTFIRTRAALDVVMDGFLVDCYLLGGALAVRRARRPGRRRRCRRRARARSLRARSRS